MLRYRAPLVEVFVEFGFEAAHFLPNVPEDHKCRRLHGHSFRTVVSVQGAVDAHAGWVMDFADVRAAAALVIAELDHQLLNDVSGLENPTSEELARWLWKRLTPLLAGLSCIEVRETCSSGCRYRGPDAP